MADVPLKPIGIGKNKSKQTRRRRTSANSGLPNRLPELGSASEASTVIVVKVGGSLLIRRDFFSGLRRQLSALGEEVQANLLIGGGEVVEAFRRLDASHQTDPAAMHWLCVDALTHTARWVADHLSEAVLIETPEAFDEHCRGRLPGRFLIAPRAFYGPDRDGGLPQDWRTTSDSIAALLAQRIAAERMLLLKSCEVPAGVSPQAAASANIVDAAFPEAVQRLAGTTVEMRAFDG